jgi:hypothetical protein
MGRALSVIKLLHYFFTELINAGKNDHFVRCKNKVKAITMKTDRRITRLGCRKFNIFEPTNDSAVAPGENNSLQQPDALKGRLK